MKNVLEKIEYSQAKSFTDGTFDLSLECFNFVQDAYNYIFDGLGPLFFKIGDYSKTQYFVFVQIMWNMDVLQFILKITFISNFWCTNP